MTHFNISDEAATIDISMSSRISVIYGDSGTGKTFLCENIRRIQKRGMHPDAANIFVVDSLQLFKLIPDIDCEYIVIDKCEQYLSRDMLATCLLNNKHKFVVFAKSGMFIPCTLFDVSLLSISEHNKHLYFKIVNRIGRF